MSAPLFSVIVPVFNRGPAIAPTLHSVQRQHLGDFECIIVDDGSRDGDVLAATVAGLNDNRFRLVKRPNGGGGAARNSGIDVARGRYVAFLDSDDLFLPEKLARFSTLLDKTRLTIWCAPVLVDRGGARRWVRPARPPRPGADIAEYLFAEDGLIQTSSLVMSHETARAIRFDPALRKGQDLDFCVRAQRLGARFVMLDTPLSIWRDVSEEGRTSRVPGTAELDAWLLANAPFLTERAVAGFRATVLAYHTAPDAPLLALRYIAQGIRWGIPPALLARQTLRCLLPRRVYRSLVDAVVARWGQRSLSRARR